MVIKIQYDARNRTFKLVHSEYGTLLEGDAVYDLSISLLDADVDEESFQEENAFVAHA